MKAIILDGWHKGEMFDWPEAKPEVTLPIPAHVISCDCDPYQGVKEFERKAGTKAYELAFVSVDRQTALYSVDGRSDAAWKSVGSLLRRERPIGLHAIYIDCQDERAWLGD